jgi:hypothetical protein
MMSGISSGKNALENALAPSTRRTARERGKVWSNQSGLAGENTVSPVPQTIRAGTRAMQSDRLCRDLAATP